MNDDTAFERWLEEQLDSHLRAHAVAPAPEVARYRSDARRRRLTPLRLGVAAALAVGAIGGGAAYASGLVHGTSVSQAASSCRTGSGDSHGDCVSVAAHTAGGAGTHGKSSAGNGVSGGKDAHGDAVSNAAHTCPTSPPGAHGQCVSAIASAGRSASGTSTPPAAPNNEGQGDSVSGAAQSGPFGPGHGAAVSGIAGAGKH